MNTTDAQFEHLLSLAEENEMLDKKERAAIMLMTSCIFDKQRVRGVLRNPKIKIQPKDKTLLLDALAGNNSHRRIIAYTILFRQFGIHKNLVAEVLSISERAVRNYHRWYKDFGFASLMNKNKQHSHSWHLHFNEKSASNSCRATLLYGGGFHES